jgi:hypothetical protein
MKVLNIIADGFIYLTYSFFDFILVYNMGLFTVLNQLDY